MLEFLTINCKSCCLFPWKGIWSTFCKSMWKPSLWKCWPWEPCVCPVPAGGAAEEWGKGNLLWQRGCHRGTLRRMLLRGLGVPLVKALFGLDPWIRTTSKIYYNRWDMRKTNFRTPGVIKGTIVFVSVCVCECTFFLI